MKRFRRNIVGAGYLAVLPLVLNGVSVFATAFIIRRLGAEHYGQWAVAASLTATTVLLSNLGLRPLFVRELSERPHEANTLVGEQLALRGLIGLACGVCAPAAAWLLRYDATVLACTMIAALGLVFTLLWTVLGDVLQARSAFAPMAVAQFAGGVALTALSTAMVAAGAGPLGVAGAYLVGPVVTFVGLALAVRKQRIRIVPIWSVERFRALIVESRHVSAQQFIATLRDRAEELLVPKLVGIGAFGYFAAGAMPADRLSIVADGISTAFYSTVASARGRDRVAAVRTMMIVVLATTIPVAVALVAAAPLLARILFAGNADRCRLVIEITAFTVPLAGVARCFTASLQAAGRHVEAARAGVAATLAGGVVSGLLIWQFGLLGACVSICARTAMQTVVLLPVFVRTFPHLFASRRWLDGEPALQT